MGNFFHFYRRSFFILVIISALFFMIILYLCSVADRQQDAIFRLKKELIEYKSKEQAEQMLQERREYR